MPQEDERTAHELQKQQDVPQVDRKKTIEFLKKKFSEYYAKAELWFPDRLPEREWAFLYFDSKGGMHRPVAFKNEAEARDFLSSRSPSHVYYSSAYYADPRVPMAEKKWLGSELIFDLDADHVKGAENLDYMSQLAKVKERFIYLIDEFLAKDFVEEKEVKIIFSGGRGYHAHITGEKIIQLTSAQRREIVDYITATGIEKEWLYGEDVYAISAFGPHVKKRVKYQMPEIDQAGWRGRMRKGIDDLLMKWEGMKKEDVIGELERFEKIGKTKAEKMYSELFDYQPLPDGELRRTDKNGRIKSIKMDKVRGVDKIRLENNMQYGETSDVFVRYVLESQSVNEIEAAETDEPVTSDIKRIIRMPTSLHGKSGLATVLLSRRELTSFEPLRDAFPSTYSDSPVKVNVIKPLEIALKGKNHLFPPGEQDVPEFAAVFLVCRGVAILV